VINNVDYVLLISRSRWCNQQARPTDRGIYIVLQPVQQIAALSVGPRPSVRTSVLHGNSRYEQSPNVSYRVLFAI